MPSTRRAAAALEASFHSPLPPLPKTPTLKTTHDLVMRHSAKEAAVQWFYNTVPLLENAFTPGITQTTDRMMRSALSPKEGAATPGTCMETLEAVKSTLKRRCSERIKEADARKRAATEAREKAISEANARAAEARLAFRATVVAREPKYSVFVVDNALRSVVK